MRAAYENNVRKCILLSTDKAVYPINAMGMTKALMEKIMIANAMLYNNKKTIFCATRYGNVAGSRGSVIPHFINQLKLNKNGNSNSSIVHCFNPSSMLYDLLVAWKN
jgi:UDP-glucose 4-epimerase